MILLFRPCVLPGEKGRGSSEAGQLGHASQPTHYAHLTFSDRRRVQARHTDTNYPHTFTPGLEDLEHAPLKAIVLEVIP